MISVNLRQGVITPKSSASYLLRNNADIDLIVDETIKVIFAHGRATYLIEEDSNVLGAWKGPFSNAQSYWFFWDMSTETGQLDYGTTQVEPSFGTTLPLSPLVDQHFFDKSDNYMKVWDGAKWIQKIRVFAGSLINGELAGAGVGSQADIYGPFTAADLRFYKVRKPIRRELDDRNFEFITNTGDPIVDVGQLENFILGRVDLSVVAGVSIPKNYVVILDNNGELAIASSAISKEALGITEVAVTAGEKKNVITRGYIQNRDWNFQEPPLFPLYVGLNGEITPSIPTSSSIQKIGHIVGPNIIFVDINPQITIIGIPTPTPTVTPTFTPTPTVTPTVTSSVTPTPAVTVTPTNTVTPTVTPTNTVTPTVTPTFTVTPTVTPVSTVTPTVTPTLTVTPTVTPSSSEVSFAADGFVAGGALDSPTQPIVSAVRGFPFSAPFTNSLTVGDLTQPLRGVGANSSNTDGYATGGRSSPPASPATYESQVESFPFSAPFTTATAVGDLTVLVWVLGSASSSTDGHSVGGFQPFPLSPTNRIERFPFAAPFTLATLVGSLDVSTGVGQGTQSSTDGYVAGGPNPIPFRTNVESFPFSTPFVNTVTVGNLAVGRGPGSATVGSATDGYAYGNVNTGNPDAIERSVDRWPFAAPFTTATNVGELDRGSTGQAGVSGSTDGFWAGGAVQAPSGPTAPDANIITSFPFAAPFTTTTDVGDVIAPVSDGLQNVRGFQPI